MACFIHSWSEWERTPGKCEEERRCLKCSKVKSRSASHSFEGWTKLPGKCEEQRICSWCGYTETRETQHTYGEWSYVKESDCTRERTCGVCGHKEFEIRHDFGSRAYTSSNSCTQIQQCNRCGAKKIFFHCHDFTDWHYKSGNSCLMIRSCERCGLTEYGEEVHEWRSSVEKDGQPVPAPESLSYQECLQNAIKYINAQIKTNESILDSLSDPSHLNTRLKYIEQNHELEIKKINYETELQNCEPESLGDICERCWQVIDWGITRQDLERCMEINEENV